MKKESKSKSRRFKKKYRIIIIVICCLVPIRLILPFVVLHYANKSLANLEGYYGHIKDIDLALYRGAYQINNIYIDKIDSVKNERTQFFNSKLIDLSIEWSALFHGSVVGELVFDNPTLIFTNDKTELDEVQKDTSQFKDIIDEFMPLRVNRFAVNAGSIHYVDKNAKPEVDVKLSDVRVLAHNLSNVTDNKNELPANVNATATAYEGKLTFNMNINPLADEPKFDLDAELNNTNLVLLNSFLKSYGNFDVNHGTFGLYTEMATSNGRFKGYVKPIIKKLDVVGPEDRHDSFFQIAWESLVATAGFVLKNQPKDQLATKVSFEGSFNNPKTKTLEAIWEVLKNAFIQALIPNIDYQISLKSVEGKGSKEEKRDKKEKKGDKKNKSEDLSINK